MKQVNFLIPVLCLTLLCGCANQNTTVAEVTPTPDVTEVPVATPTPKPTIDPEEWIWDYYVTDYKVTKYVFRSVPAIDETKIVFTDDKSKEEQVFDVCNEYFNYIKQNLDKIDVIYLYFADLYTENYCGYDGCGVSMCAVLDDEELLNEWKTLVKDAELQLSRNYKYGDKTVYTGGVERPGVHFSANISGEIRDLFSSRGHYYCQCQMPVTSFKFSSDEMKDRYTALLRKLNELAGERYEKAFVEPGNYPYLTN